MIRGRARLSRDIGPYGDCHALLKHLQATKSLRVTAAKQQVLPGEFFSAVDF